MKKIILSIILFIFFTNNTSAQIIHVYVFANTLDSQIGKSCDIDKEQIIVNIKTAARVLNYEMDLKVFDDNDFNFENVKKSINSLSCNSNDIVFFYYTGHGSRAQNDVSEFPQLNFNKEGQNVDDYFVPLEALNNIIEQQNPKLSIVIADCCNAYSNISPKVSMKGMTTVTDEKTPIELFEKLFKNVRGSVLVSSSKVGEYSYSDPEKGGFFTKNYLDSFAKALNKEINPSWEGILIKTKKMTLKESNNCNGCENQQTPQYKIDVQYDISPVPVVPNNDDYIVEINKLLNKNINNSQKTKKLNTIINQFFDKDATVYTIAKNGKTIIDTEDVKHYLYRLIYTHSIINIVELDSKKAFNKISILRVHEIRLKK